MNLLFSNFALVVGISAAVQAYGTDSGRPSSDGTTPQPFSYTTDRYGNGDGHQGQWSGVGNPDYQGGGGTRDQYSDPRYPSERPQTYGQRSNFTKRSYVERYGYPEGCAQSREYKTSCNFYVEISRHENDPDPNVVLFEVSRHFHEDDESGYVGVGLSRDRKMGDDHIVECIKTQSGKTIMYHSWSGGQRRPDRLEDDGNVFQILDHFPQYNSQSKTLTCQFWRKIRTNVVVNGQPIEFDLVRGKYYVLLASGPMEPKLNSEALGYHGNPQSFNTYVSRNLLGYSKDKFPEPVEAYENGKGSKGSKPSRGSGSGQAGACFTRSTLLFIAFIFSSPFVFTLF